MTPLMEAVKNRHYDVVKLLLDKGANVNLTNIGGSTALLLASMDRKMDYDIIKLLLEYGSDVNVTDKLGRSPYDYGMKYQPDVTTFFK